MVRRAHKKSRNGCLECKRRHVKCDEKRPTCSHCIASERHCEYGARFLFAPPRASASQSPAPTPALSPAESPASASAVGADTNHQPANMLHIELMHNLYTNTYATFDPTRTNPWVSELFSQSISNPYLVNEMLAFSAIHMSTIHPERQSYYHYHAAQLQTHSLAMFKDKESTNSQVTHETAVPLFLFSSLLGTHMLCDTLIYRDRSPGSDFDTFLDKFTHYLRLHHGVRTIVREASTHFRSSVVEPALEVWSEVYKFNGALNPPLIALMTRISSAKLGPDLTNTYRHVIECLQVCTNVTDSSDQRHAGIHGVIAWPVLVELGFASLLEGRRPEALVVLAHWAVLVHRFQDSWLFGDSGWYIIHNVRAHLGPEWDEWLEGPRGVLESSMH